MSLCHNPSEGKLTITIKSAEGLQAVSKTGKISMMFLAFKLFLQRKNSCCLFGRCCHVDVVTRILVSRCP